MKDKPFKKIIRKGSMINMSREEKEQNRSIRIVSLDGSDVYRAMHRVGGEQGISVKDDKGKLVTFNLNLVRNEQVVIKKMF